MALVQIEETELAEMKKRLAELEAREQNILSRMELYEGSIIRERQALHSGILTNRKFLLDWGKKAPAPVVPQKIVDREAFVEKLQLDVDEQTKVCQELDDTWQKFTQDHPVATDVILRFEREKKEKRGG